MISTVYVLELPTTSVATGNSGNWNSHIIFVLSLLILFFGIKGKVKIAIIAIVLLGFSIRVFMSLDGHLHKWDERYHALVAKHMIENPLKPVLLKTPPKNFDYKDWTQNHIWLHKPPFSLWLIAGSIHVFGVHEFSVRIPSILLSTLSIVLIFAVARKLFDNKVALLSAYLFAINGFMLEQASGRITSDHVDTVFLFVCLASLSLFLMRKNSWQWKHVLLASLFFGFALLTKSLIALLIPVIFIVNQYDALKRGEIKRIVLGLTLLVIPGFALYLLYGFYMESNYPLEYAWESHYNLLHFTSNHEDHGEPWYYFLNVLRIKYNELVYLPLCFIIYQWIKKRDAKAILLGAWIFIPLVVFSCAETKMPGYLNISSPAIFISIGWFSFHIKQPSTKPWLSPLVISFVLILGIRYSFERIKPFKSVEEKNPVWSDNIKKGKPEANHEIEFLFYND